MLNMNTCMFTSTSKYIREYLPEIPYPICRKTIRSIPVFWSVLKRYQMDMNGLPTFCWDLLWAPKKHLLRYCMPQNAKKVLKISPWSWALAPLVLQKKRRFGQKSWTSQTRWRIFKRLRSPNGGPRRANGFRGSPWWRSRCWGVRRALKAAQRVKSDVASADWDDSVCEVHRIFSVLQCGLKKARVGGFKSFLLISYSTWGDDPIWHQFDLYFSIGLKAPPIYL